MKNLFKLVLAGTMALSLAACSGGGNSGGGGSAAPADSDSELVKAAKADGELVVYGSCEEEYLAAACENFEKLYGIKVQY
ncbi:MAG: hypothetical protein Q4D46_07035, partial [Erysipelotrichaceae bacterium]|nr:hypothetical protein [Erysipelotrichaceae bacterium]